MKRVYSVGQVNRYVKNMFLQDFVLKKVYVKGEVSNCKYHPSGHIYFSLKDETGVLSCVMFAGHRRGLAFRMKDGDQVVVGGAVDVYERDGRYQLYAKEITQEGEGVLYERFLALKRELEEMGMFAQEYKQPIPEFIRRLGVVTAPAGAAIQDIRNISLRRNPYVSFIGNQIGGHQGKQNPVIGFQYVIREDKLPAVHRDKGKYPILALLHIFLHPFNIADGCFLGILFKYIIQPHKGVQIRRGNHHIAFRISDAG